MTLDDSEYLELLQTADDEISEALKLNSKIARMLHNVKVAKVVSEEEVKDVCIADGVRVDNEPYTTLVFFKFMMERGENIK